MNSQKARDVRRMFSGIAHRYDFLNHFLSLGTDILWRKASVRRLKRRLPATPGPILDLCCGTGDLTDALSRLRPVVGCDFCHPMLVIARQKLNGARRPNPIAGLVEGDALSLPFPDNSFQAVTVAFGVRNFADVPTGLREIHRVLAPGGVIAVLEFSHVVLPGFRQFFNFYFHRVLPRIGQWISGRDGAYSYLPDSVSRFPDAPTFEAMLTATGFSETAFRRFTFGVAALHIGRK